MQTTTQIKDTGNTVFEAKTRETVDVKRLIKALADTVEDTPVTIDQDGIRFHAADASLVALIDLKLKPELFDRWQPPAEPVTFGLNAGKLKGKVGEAKKGDELTLKVTEEHVDGELKPVLHVSIYQDGIRSTFTLTTIEPDTERPETDDLEFTGEALVSLKPLRDAIKKLGDSIQFTLTEDGLDLDSEEAGAQVTFPHSSDHIHAIQTNNEPVTSRYAQDYLTTIRKIKNTAERVEIRFGTDFPLRVKADTDQFTLEYTLAPRIEE